MRVPTFLLAFISTAVAIFPTKLLYQPPTGLFIENIAVRPNSKLLLTSVLSPTLHTFDPTIINSTYDEVFTFPNATGLTGIAEYRPDVYAVAASIINFETQSEEPGSVVIWSVDFTSKIPRFRAVAHFPATTPVVINGLTAVPGSPDIVLAADSSPGGVYEINMRSGAIRKKFQDVLMTPTGPPPPLGINGLHIHHNFLYFTNSARGALYRMPLHGGTIEKLGDLSKFGEIGVAAFDDFAIDGEGRVWVAMSSGALQLFYRAANGTWVQETAAGNPAGGPVLVGPTSGAFARKGLGGARTRTLYVTTAGGQLVAVDTSRRIQ
ncbi:hypothetical protein R3P38DRAFT_2599518 [Favolaschia claudopus]|uniref:SMP-30/Gluconolactonase/LRE-like region domain-containing protein n=1 Tax=Favolaschia claudopus TaxID=2862362 RepID=A0AAW0E194_9AGAR